MSKIPMKTALVEMDGDEMTRVIWKEIKERLLLPYVELKTEYFDLGLPERDRTDDKITVEAAERTLELGVAVKCATITPNKQRVEEYKLKEMWKSPNGTIRAIMDGTVFRTPIVSEALSSYVPNWKKPITIARHAYGDIYKNAEMLITAPAKVSLVAEYGDGRRETVEVQDMEGPGVVMGMHNYDKSIGDFARSCFNFALDKGENLCFSAKDTISKIYDHRFKDIFSEIFEAEFKEKFEKKGIEYFYTLIDDMVARVMRGEGGIIWACKNYDGDVMSDMVASAAGSLAMMSSVLVSPRGAYEYEAAHGTVTRHYYKYLKGEETSTNPVATIFAWTGALSKRGELDGTKRLSDFAAKLEKATLCCINEGYITGDLLALYKGESPHRCTSNEFLDRIAMKYEELAGQEK